MVRLIKQYKSCNKDDFSENEFIKIDVNKRSVSLNFKFNDFGIVSFSFWACSENFMLFSVSIYILTYRKEREKCSYFTF